MAIIKIGNSLGVVLLSGTASSVSDHLGAILDASGVKGVRRVASEVEALEFVRGFGRCCWDLGRQHGTPQASIRASAAAITQ